MEDFLNSLDDKHHYFAAPMSLHARLNKAGLADVYRSVPCPFSKNDKL
jgi:hypothetical protein